MTDEGRSMNVEHWKRFWIQDVGLRDADAANEYAVRFVEEDLSKEIISSLNEQHLLKLGVNKMGHRIAFLDHVKKIEGEKTSLPGTSKDLFNFADLMNVQNDHLRRDFYCSWANSVSIRFMYNDVVQRMEDFFRNSVIVINLNSTENQDILFSFVKEENITSEVDHVEELLPGQVKVYDLCLNHPILVSQTILTKHERTAASSQLKQIGYQHVYKHRMVDTDAKTTSDSSIDYLLSSSTADDLDNEEGPSTKKRRMLNLMKTCQLKIFMDCQDMLKLHEDNTTKLSYTQTKLEILILYPLDAKDICQKVAYHLGLVFVEDLYKKIEENAKNKQLFNNTSDKHAKLYCLVQNYIARCLMLGFNNISLTCDINIFTNISSDVKCAIFKDENKIRDLTIQRHVNMTVRIRNNSFLDYLSGITEIINHTLEYKTSLPALYCILDNKDKKYYRCQFPGVGVIPLYILKFFVKKKLAEEDVKKSIFCH